MASKSGPDIIEDGLVLCLDAASKRSYPGTGTTWTDLKGDNNGILTNSPTFSSGGLGKIIFDATDEKVVIPSTDGLGPSNNLTYANIYESLINNFSLEFVCEPYNTIEIISEGNTGYPAVSSTQKHLFNSAKYAGDNVSAHAAALVSIGTNGLQIIAHADSYMPCYLSYSATLSSVNYFVLTFTSSQPSLYLNGVLVRSKPSIANRTLGFTSYQIGNGGGYPSATVDLYTFKAYNRALTADEIRRNYLSTKERFA
jgi:hypothetical protein